MNMVSQPFLTIPVMISRKKIRGYMWAHLHLDRGQDMTREDVDFISGMNMCDEISNEAYQKIMCHCEEQDSILDQIKAEIEQTEINGHIRDVECFRAGINVALNVIDKYKAGE